MELLLLSSVCFLNRHWNVTYYNLHYTVLSIECFHPQTHMHQTICFCQTKNLWIIVCIYFVHIFSHITCILHLPLQMYTHQDQLAINCSRTVHNDSTCQVWSCCVKLHRVQWPPGVSSQFWQMAKAGSGSAVLGAVWLITPPADTNTATEFVCRLLYSVSFLLTRSNCIPTLFLFLLIACNSQPKSKKLCHGFSKNLKYNT